MAEDDLRAQIETNFFGVVNVTRGVARAPAERLTLSDDGVIARPITEVMS
jgi:hypothetical protein